MGSSLWAYSTTDGSEEDRLSWTSSFGRNAPRLAAPARPLLKRQKLKSLLPRFLRRRSRIQQQPQSAFLNLPLEIRHDIYLYIFASSLVYHTDFEDTLTSWDRLGLTCQQVKVEMESIPTQPVISMVTSRWNARFSENPLDVSFSSKDGVVIELRIRIPRAVLQAPYTRGVQYYIPHYISPLFRLYTDSLRISILDDGSPRLNSDGGKAHYWLFHQIHSTVWAREQLYRAAGKAFPNHLLPPPSRNYFNAKKVTAEWRGSLDEEHQQHLGMWIWTLLEWWLLKPVRRRIHLDKRKLGGKWTGNLRYCVNEVSWESKARFR